MKFSNLSVNRADGKFRVEINFSSNGKAYQFVEFYLQGGDLSGIIDQALRECFEQEATPAKHSSAQKG